MINTINIKKYYVLSRNVFFIFLVIFIPRLIYSLLFDNYTGDSPFYLDIVDNISKGCGFSFTNTNGECEPLIGGIFPGYLIFLYSLKSIGIGDKFIPISVSLFTTFSYIYLIFTLNCLGLNGKKLYVFILLIALSPLSIGYSRFINMDPILNIFSILIITELIKLKKNLIHLRHTSLRVLIYIISAIYIKPTSIILILPYFLFILIHFGYKKFIQSFISFLLVITILILPWGIRDLKLGADIPFKSCGNQLGNNVCSLNNWVTSFVLTEYEYASIMYPIYDREMAQGKRQNFNQIQSLYFKK